MAFDIPYLDGRDLRELPLLECKGILRAIVPADSPLLYATTSKARAATFSHEICRLDLEGIVAKWKGGAYLSGDVANWI